MKSFALLSAVASVAVATHAGSYGHHGYGYGQGSAVFQSVHHGAPLSHGSEYGASGDLLGMHSFPGYGHGLVHGGHHGGLGGHGFALGGHHGGLLASGHYGGHHGFQLADYGLPERSKLYGGYVGGFGGYAKGALESIQHLNHGGHRLHSVSYGAPKASPVPFGGHGGLGAHGHSLDLHAPVAHYEGHHLGHYGVGIGGMQYGVDYKKAKAAA